MAREFSMQRGTTRVVFGAGASGRIPQEIEALGVQRVLVACTAGRKAEAAALAATLGARGVGVLALAREHVPVETVTEAGREVERSGADAVLALGGGSAIGLAKALARSARVRVLAIPTTYSGSEMTPVYGITEGGEKKTGRDERVRPALVVYDPRLTLALSREVTMPSLWNAMAHAVEGLWVAGADRGVRLAAEEALRLLASSATRLAVRLGDEEAREDALEGAYLAGGVFADAGGGLHHKLCHVLGGTFGLPHAATHAALLPHVVRFHREATPEAMSAIARALGVLDPVEGTARLAQVTGVAVGLEKLGLSREALERVADVLLAAPPFHPRPLERASLGEMLRAAWSGPPARPAPSRLRGPETLAHQPGLGSTHESEALPGALPRRQNAPRRGPFGLYPELLNGTPFTVRSAENSRVWMYRIRPSFSHAAFLPLPAARFAAPLGEVDPNRARWRPLPIPAAPASVDFLDGLVTLGGAGDPTAGPGYAVHLYAANADMTDRSFADADGDLLVVPQTGTLEVRTELGWLRVPPGSFLVVPRALKFSIGVPDGGARGWVLEVFGRRLRLPERGPIGSNGLADARHFQAPTAAFEDRACPAGFQIVNKLGGRLYAATQGHSPFDVVAWHGSHAPFSYDLSLFNAMGSVTFDHPDPSILTVLTAPLDDHGRAIADFVVFPGRWEVIEHSFRPPFMHRNAASEVNMVVRTPSPESGYDPGCTFVSPLLTGHGVSTATYDHVLGLPDDHEDPPRRLPDESLWVMFESAMPFRATAWARETPLVDGAFLALFEGMRSRFDPKRP
ncbi:MAG TPA: iron-containing alcohol dehydrogenase [Polyangiaceae bacterium]